MLKTSIGRARAAILLTCAIGAHAVDWPVSTYSGAPPASAYAGPARASCSNTGDIGDALRSIFATVADKNGITQCHIHYSVTIDQNGRVNRISAQDDSCPAEMSAAARSKLNQLRCQPQKSATTMPFDLAFRLDE